MRVQEVKTDEGILEMRVQKMNREKLIFLIKLIIVDIDSLFKLYLAIIWSLCFNTLQILHEKGIN